MGREEEVIAVALPSRAEYKGLVVMAPKKTWD